MFRELKNVTQHSDTDGYRRWFWDDGYDLIVWYSDAGTIRGFQLCYDTQGRERAFTWHEGGAVIHSGVDSGEGSPLTNRSPVLVPNRQAAVLRVLAEFMERCERLERPLFELVTAKLSAFDARAMLCSSPGIPLEK
jgi:hypothetical protein